MRQASDEVYIIKVGDLYYATNRLTSRLNEATQFTALGVALAIIGQIQGVYKNNSISLLKVKLQIVEEVSR